MRRVRECVVGVTADERVRGSVYAHAHAHVRHDGVTLEARAVVPACLTASASAMGSVLPVPLSIAGLRLLRRVLASVWQRQRVEVLHRHVRLLATGAFVRSRAVFVRRKKTGWRENIEQSGVVALASKVCLARLTFRFAVVVLPCVHEGCDH